MPTRRRLLSALASLPAWPALAQSAGRLSHLGDGMHFGLVTYMWGADWDVPTLIEQCQRAKLDGVELRIEHAHGVHAGLDAAARREVRNRFEGSSVTLLGMGTNCEFHSPQKAEVEQQMALARQFIRLSHDIGGSGVKVKPNALPKGVEVERTLEQIGNCLAQLGDEASGFGQEIRLEVHGGVTDLAQIARIMEIANRDNVRVCWNSNDADLKGSGIEANFAMVKAMLGSTVHVRELDQPKYPFAKLIALLAAEDYAGWVLLEASSKPADRGAALAEQRRLFDQMLTQARRQLAS